MLVGNVLFSKQLKNLKRGSIDMEMKRLFDLSKKQKKTVLTQSEYTERKKLVDEIEAFIKNNCKTAIEEETFRKRYIEGLSWKKVADELLDMTDDAPRKRITRALSRYKNCSF